MDVLGDAVMDALPIWARGWILKHLTKTQGGRARDYTRAEARMVIVCDEDQKPFFGRFGRNWSFNTKTFRFRTSRTAETATFGAT